MKVLFGFFIFFIFLTLNISKKSSTSSSKCPEFSLYETEEVVLEAIKERIASKETIGKECLINLLSRGYFQSVSELYQNYFLLRQPKDLNSIQSELKNYLTSHRRELDTISNVLLSMNSKEIPSSYPVFSWAQSRDHILIYVKFAHRMDSPACVNIKSEAVNISETSITVDALCITGHKPLKYELNLTLFEPIVPETSKWTKEIGNFQFNLTKNSTNNLWRRLLLENVKTQIWFDMKKYVARDMEDYFRMLEDEVKEKERLEEEAKKEARKKAKKEKKNKDK